jgi:deazaflavin-dependent oxidoreductase (nitroreductase family)
VGSGVREDEDYALCARLGDLMRDDVRRALAISRSATLEERTIDITTTGRRSGEPRRIEICLYRLADAIYLSGVPGPRTRDWLVNLAADPHFTFHLKHGTIADLPAVAEVITDPAERRRVLTDFVDDFNERNGPGSPWPKAVLDEWAERSPLARVRFEEADSGATDERDDLSTAAAQPPRMRIRRR